MVRPTTLFDNWTTFLHSNCYFTTGVASSDNGTKVSEMASLLHRVPNHHMIAVGNARPSTDAASLQNRAMLWARLMKQVCNVKALVTVKE